MKEFIYTIKDEQGIHARPAGALVKLAAGFASKVTIAKDGREVDAKCIMSVMSLGVKKGNIVTIKADGADENTAISQLEEFISHNL